MKKETMFYVGLGLAVVAAVYFINKKGKKTTPVAQKEDLPVVKKEELPVVKKSDLIEPALSKNRGGLEEYLKSGTVSNQLGLMRVMKMNNADFLDFVQKHKCSSSEFGIVPLPSVKNTFEKERAVFREEMIIRGMDVSLLDNYQCPYNKYQRQ